MMSFTGLDQLITMVKKFELKYREENWISILLNLLYIINDSRKYL